MEGYEGRESANKLWDHPKLDQVLRLHSGEVGVPLPLVLLLAGQRALLLTCLCRSPPTLATLSAGKKTDKISPTR